MHNRHHPPIQLALPPPDIDPYLVAACAIYDEFIGPLGDIDARGVWGRKASAQVSLEFCRNSFPRFLLKNHFLCSGL